MRFTKVDTPQMLGDVPDTRTADDARDFSAFVRVRYQWLLQFLSSRTESPEDAADVAQQSFIKLMRYRTAPSSDWPRLLYCIAANAAHDQFRRARSYRDVRRRTATMSADAPTEQLPDAFTLRTQQIALLRQAIIELPPKCQRVYVLKLTYDLTNAEIADGCGISVKMVEKHLATGLETLRRKVGNLAATTLKKV